LALLLGPLTAFGPVSTDLYLPALPHLTQYFAVSESDVQLTLTASLIGLALGQLLAGPCSDAFGRRRPMLIGLAIYTLASAGCALSPSMTVLIGLRLAQGLAGGSGLVIARAVARDLFDGPELARFLSQLMLVFALAPILAPLIGSQLLLLVPWQGLFVLLAAYGLALLVASASLLPESLPPAGRNRPDLLTTGRVIVALMFDRHLISYALTLGLTYAAMFSYISGSPFVLQQNFGLSAQLYGVAYAANAFGIAVLAQLNRALLRRFPIRSMLAAGLCLASVGGIGQLAAIAAGWGSPAVLPALFAVVASVGMVLPNATALALDGQSGQAGSAAAVLGLLQYLLAAIAAPLAGTAGSASALPMAILICGLTLVALLCFTARTRHTGGRPLS
jgi:DHA1 family bicyclomycin/chloramphenicol resistance-like MFS transporter